MGQVATGHVAVGQIGFGEYVLAQIGQSAEAVRLAEEELRRDPFNTGAITIPLNRSLYEHIEGVREQVNAITAFIDASNVYGSDPTRAGALRTFDNGQLLTRDDALLPLNTIGLPSDYLTWHRQRSIRRCRAVCWMQKRSGASS